MVEDMPTSTTMFGRPAQTPQTPTTSQIDQQAQALGMTASQYISRMNRPSPQNFTPSQPSISYPTQSQPSPALSTKPLQITSTSASTGINQIPAWIESQLNSGAINSYTNPQTNQTFYAHQPGTNQGGIWVNGPGESGPINSNFMGNYVNPTYPNTKINQGTKTIYNGASVLAPHITYNSSGTPTSIVNPTLFSNAYGSYETFSPQSSIISLENGKYYNPYGNALNLSSISDPLVQSATLSYNVSGNTYTFPVTISLQGGQINAQIPNAATAINNPSLAYWNGYLVPAYVKGSSYYINNQLTIPQTPTDYYDQITNAYKSGVNITNVSSLPTNEQQMLQNNVEFSTTVNPAGSPNLATSQNNQATQASPALSPTDALNIANLAATTGSLGLGLTGPTITNLYLSGITNPDTVKKWYTSLTPQQRTEITAGDQFSVYYNPNAAQNTQQLLPITELNGQGQKFINNPTQQTQAENYLNEAENYLSSVNPIVNPINSLITNNPKANVDLGLAKNNLNSILANIGVEGYNTLNNAYSNVVNNATPLVTNALSAGQKLRELAQKMPHPAPPQYLQNIDAQISAALNTNPSPKYELGYALGNAILNNEINKNQNTNNPSAVKEFGSMYFNPKLIDYRLQQAAFNTPQAISNLYRTFNGNPNSELPTPFYSYLQSSLPQNINNLVQSATNNVQNLNIPNAFKTPLQVAGTIDQFGVQIPNQYFSSIGYLGSPKQNPWQSAYDLALLGSTAVMPEKAFGYGLINGGLQTGINQIFPTGASPYQAFGQGYQFGAASAPLFVGAQKLGELAQKTLFENPDTLTNYQDIIDRNNALLKGLNNSNYPMDIQQANQILISNPGYVNGLSQTQVADILKNLGSDQGISKLDAIAGSQKAIMTDEILNNMNQEIAARYASFLPTRIFNLAGIPLYQAPTSALLGGINAAEGYAQGQTSPSQITNNLLLGYMLGTGLQTGTAVLGSLLGRAKTAIELYKDPKSNMIDLRGPPSINENGKLYYPFELQTPDQAVAARFLMSTTDKIVQVQEIADQIKLAADKYKLDPEEIQSALLSNSKDGTLKSNYADVVDSLKQTIANHASPSNIAEKITTSGEEITPKNMPADPLRKAFYDYQGLFNSVSAKGGEANVYNYLGVRATLNDALSSEIQGGNRADIVTNMYHPNQYYSFKDYINYLNDNNANLKMEDIQAQTQKLYSELQKISSDPKISIEDQLKKSQDLLTSPKYKSLENLYSLYITKANSLGATQIDTFHPPLLGQGELETQTPVGMTEKPVYNISTQQPISHPNIIIEPNTGMFNGTILENIFPTFHFGLQTIASPQPFDLSDKEKSILKVIGNGRADLALEMLDNSNLQINSMNLLSRPQIDEILNVISQPKYTDVFGTSTSPDQYAHTFQNFVDDISKTLKVQSPELQFNNGIDSIAMIKMTPGQRPIIYVNMQELQFNAFRSGAPVDSFLKEAITHELMHLYTNTYLPNFNFADVTPEEMQKLEIPTEEYTSKAQNPLTKEALKIENPQQTLNNEAIIRQFTNEYIDNPYRNPLDTSLQAEETQPPQETLDQMSTYPKLSKDLTDIEDLGRKLGSSEISEKEREAINPSRSIVNPSTQSSYPYPSRSSISPSRISESRVIRSSSSPSKISSPSPSPSTSPSISPSLSPSTSPSLSPYPSQKKPIILPYYDNSWFAPREIPKSLGESISTMYHPSLYTLLFPNSNAQATQEYNPLFNALSQRPLQNPQASAQPSQPVSPSISPIVPSQYDYISPNSQMNLSNTLLSSANQPINAQAQSNINSALQSDALKNAINNYYNTKYPNMGFVYPNTLNQPTIQQYLATSPAYASSFMNNIRPELSSMYPSSSNLSLSTSNLSPSLNLSPDQAFSMLYGTKALNQPIGKYIQALGPSNVMAALQNTNKGYTANEINALLSNPAYFNNIQGNPEYANMFAGGLNNGYFSNPNINSNMNLQQIAAALDNSYNMTPQNTPAWYILELANMGAITPQMAQTYLANNVAESITPTSSQNQMIFNKLKNKHIPIGIKT